jgi:hypothetical protein
MSKPTKDAKKFEAPKAAAAEAPKVTAQEPKKAPALA